jgi:Phage integrase, N-terminal SAM-like domain
MTQKRRSKRLAGAIRKLPSGRDQARFRGPDGDLQPAPMTFWTKAEADADAWLASETTDVARGEWIDPDAGKVLLRDYAKQWMAGKAVLAPKTVELYQYLLDRVILPPLSDLPLNAITPMRVRVWRAELLMAGKPGESTIAKAYRLLSGIMSTAVIDSMIVRNPCVEKGAGVERATEIRAATPEEVAVLASAIAPRYRAMDLTAAYAGCRWGELTGLRQRNLDLDGACLSVVEQAVELRSGVRIIRAPKTDAVDASFTCPTGSSRSSARIFASSWRPIPTASCSRAPTELPLAAEQLPQPPLAACHPPGRTAGAAIP